MLFIPRVFDTKHLKEKYRCPRCDGFVRLDASKCRHCGTGFSDVMREEMSAAFAGNARRNFPLVMISMGVALLVVLLVAAVSLSL